MNGIHVFELISIWYTMCWMLDDMNIYKSNSFLHLPNMFSIFFIAALLVIWWNKYVISSAVIVPVPR